MVLHCDGGDVAALDEGLAGDPDECIAAEALGEELEAVRAVVRRAVVHVQDAQGACVLDGADVGDLDDDAGMFRCAYKEVCDPGLRLIGTECLEEPPDAGIGQPADACLNGKAEFGGAQGLQDIAADVVPDALHGHAGCGGDDDLLVVHLRCFLEYPESRAIFNVHVHDDHPGPAGPDDAYALTD